MKRSKRSRQRSRAERLVHLQLVWPAHAAIDDHGVTSRDGDSLLELLVVPELLNFLCRPRNRYRHVPAAHTMSVMLVDMASSPITAPGCRATHQFSSCRFQH